MKKLIPEDQYLHSLPKKRMGVGVIFFDEDGKLLILKPNYKKYGWSIPGGIIDGDESPRDGAIRETAEEIGLNIPNMDFLILEYGYKQGEKTEGLEFMFNGGVLSKEQVESIVPSPEEFDDCKFAPIDEALELLRPSIRRRTLKALEVLKTGIPAYSEFPEE